MFRAKIFLVLFAISAPGCAMPQDSRDKGGYKVMGPQEQIKTKVGQDVILPCFVKPPFDATILTVEWRSSTKVVHVYRNRGDDPILQHKDFINRTSLCKDEMKNGNVSLKLSSVKMSDGGNYTCFVPKLGGQVRKGHVVLIVEEKDATRNKVHATTLEVPVNEGNGTENPSHRVGVGKIVSLILFIIVIIGIIIVKSVRCRKHGNRVREEEGSNPVELDDLRNTDDDA